MFPRNRVVRKRPNKTKEICFISWLVLAFLVEGVNGSDNGFLLFTSSDDLLLFVLFSMRG